VPFAWQSVLPHPPDPVLSSIGNTSFAQLTAQFPVPVPVSPPVVPESLPGNVPASPPSAGGGGVVPVLVMVVVVVAVGWGACRPTSPSGGPYRESVSPPQAAGSAPAATIITRSRECKRIPRT
jgi:hypothetical protein